MATIMEKLYGSPGKEGCNYFYFFSIAGFVLFAFTMISLIGYVVFNFKKMDKFMVGHAFVMSFSYLLLYYSNRLLYNMCIKTL